MRRIEKGWRFVLLLLAIAAVLALCMLAVLAVASAQEAQNEPAASREIATVYDRPADGDTETVTVTPQNMGPLYSLPLEYEQEIVCDRSNRAYILVTSETGFSIVPYLDEDGEQVVIPNA